MKYSHALLIALLMTGVACRNVNGSADSNDPSAEITPANTILVEENDTPEQIMAKAVATRPSERQLAATATASRASTATSKHSDTEDPRKHQTI